MVRLHCELHRNRRGKFQAICLETSVAVVADTPEQARNKLNRALGTYLESVADELQRLADEGRLDLSDLRQVKREIDRYFRRVPFYPLRLLMWHIGSAIHRTHRILRILSAEVERFVEERSVPIPAHG